MAEAQIDGRIHVVKKRRWERTQDLQKRMIEVGKRLKQWWKPQADGKLLLASTTSTSAGPSVLVHFQIGPISPQLRRLLR
jgi:hypothetical protein